MTDTRTTLEASQGRAIRRATQRAALAMLAVGTLLLPLTRTAQAQTYTVLYNFAGAAGSLPGATLIADSAGNFYGTTVDGGAYGYGTVFELAATGKETVLYSFTGGSDGALPTAALMRDSAGNLYGTAEEGGTINSTCPSGCGVVFRLGLHGQEKVLYSFSGGSDGNTPQSNLVRDASGNLYGTTLFGGVDGWGVVFKLSRAGGETVLYSFTDGSDGANPSSGLTTDASGNLYGTTFAGGDTSSCSGFGCGVVYRVDPGGSETALYSFTGGSDGMYPDSTLARDAMGNLYGTAENGGNSSCADGCGVVFKLDSAGNETTLYSFSGPDGEYPSGGLVRDTAGNLYGVTFLGGATGNGAVFQLGPSGKETVLHSLTGADGQMPRAGLLAYKGSLYGTADAGGSGNGGVAFKMVP